MPRDRRFTGRSRSGITFTDHTDPLSENYRIDTAETITQMMDRDNWSDYFLIILEHELPDGRTDELLPRLKKLAPMQSC